VSRPGFQVSLDLDGRPCLVIGGGRTAEERVGRLLDAGARVTLVSPGLTPGLCDLAENDRFRHVAREFRESDLEGIFLVMNTLMSDPGLSRRLLDLSRERGFLLNAHDQPAHSNFLMPALVRRGKLRIAIGTSGASPGIARRIRQGLSAMFDEEFEAYLDWVAGVRRRARAEEPDPNRRFVRMQEATEGFGVEGRVVYPKAWPRGGDA
jgi:precorrin-2 dehydrogenase/sirohydrochlorin ferrochelatase